MAKTKAVEILICINFDLYSAQASASGIWHQAAALLRSRKDDLLDTRSAAAIHQLIGITLS